MAATDVPPSNPEPRPAPGKDLGKRAKQASLWVSGGFFLSQLIRMLATVVVTRQLDPADYGVMAIVNTIYTGLSLFSDLGIGPSVIQSKREDPSFLNTAFTMQFGRGLTLTLVGALLAVPMAEAYDEPRLKWLLPVVASTAAISGLSSTRGLTLNRQLSLGRLQGIRLASQLIGTGLMVTWALIYQNVWALALAHVGTTVAFALMSHLCLPGIRNRFHWDRDAARALIRFGRWIFLSTVMTFVVGEAHKLLFGKLTSQAELGIYHVGAMLAALPQGIINKLSTAVVFPYYSETWRRDGHLDHVFDKVRALILLAGGWAFSGLLAGGPVATRLLYEGEFEQAGLSVQLLAIGGFLLTLNISHGEALLAMGHARWVTASSVAKLIAMCALLPAGYHIGSSLGDEYTFPGLILGYSLSELFRALISAYALRSFGIQTHRGDLRYTGMFLLVGGLGFLVCPQQGEWFSEVPIAGQPERFPWGELVDGLLIAVGVSLLWLPIAWPIVKATLRRRAAG